jgi:hypothetical protein
MSRTIILDNHCHLSSLLQPLFALVGNLIHQFDIVFLVKAALDQSILERTIRLPYPQNTDALPIGLDLVETFLLINPAIALTDWTFQTTA